MLELIDQRRAFARQMRVRIDDRGHHGLSRQVDARRTRWRLELASPPDLREAIALDDECGVLDRRAAVADDEARAFEECGASLRGLGFGADRRNDGPGEDETD